MSSLFSYEGLLEAGSLKCIQGSILGLPNEEWHLFVTTPIPEQEQIELVMHDIIEGKAVEFKNGQLCHSRDCTYRKHRLDSKYKNIIPLLQKETFKVAIYSNSLFEETDSVIKKGYGGQPLAIILEPDVNFSIYPDHPHLSAPYSGKGKDGVACYLPEPICYGYKDLTAEKNKQEILYEVLAQVSIWLFRHQIWVASRNLYGKGIWIGPASNETLPPIDYIGILNPDEPCRCGSRASYKSCHLPKDVCLVNKIDLEQAKQIVEDKTPARIDQWNKDTGTPRTEAINKLKSNLM